MGELTEVDQEVASALVERVALALVNHRLRVGLRKQSIRDPLTGLFNRRYMGEALALEFARGERTGEPIGIIMADIDHCSLVRWTLPEPRSVTALSRA